MVLAKSAVRNSSDRMQQDQQALQRPFQRLPSEGRSGFVSPGRPLFSARPDTCCSCCGARNHSYDACPNPVGLDRARRAMAG